MTRRPAARAAGVRWFVAQSFASYRHAPQGGPVKTEDDPLDPRPSAMARETRAAMSHLDQAVTDAGGIALRYGGFYGGSSDGLVTPVRRRQFPVIGDGSGISSFVHLDDAAAATVLALDHDGAGICTIVDDDPAPMSDWLPALAAALGAKPPPRHVRCGSALPEHRTDVPHVPACPPGDPSCPGRHPWPPLSASDAIMPDDPATPAQSPPGPGPG